jgi:hypothetical protein
MDLRRRGFLAWGFAAVTGWLLRRRLEFSGIGEVAFCRVSDEKLLTVARSIYPRCIASCEPREGFRGITFCGAKATVTVALDRLS